MKKQVQDYQEWLAYQRQWFKSPRGRYHQHKASAGKRGIEFLLTFEEWWDIWQASGKWEQRGRRRDQYVMARLGDVGPYERHNIRICLVGENVGESNQKCDNPTEQRSAVMKAWWISPAGLQLRNKLRRHMTAKRAVLRNGRLTWANPGDKDYPD